MSMPFTRTDDSALSKWWWTVDRWTLVAVGLLIGLGALLVTAASPSVAERIHLPTFYFVVHQALMLAPTLALMIAVSLLGPRGVRRLSFAMLALFYGLTALTLAAGTEIKGATRWIAIGPASLQPSEFLKPAFAVVSAWFFARQHAARAAGEFFPGYGLAILLFLAVVGILLAQPDFGMAFVCAVVWVTEFFLAGLPIVLVVALAVMGIGALVAAYFVFPHVASRINRFLDPASGNTYQVDRAHAAFIHGGLTGTGPGQGTVELSLPDAHADFIFAVAGEELGLAATLFIVLLFGFIIVRGFARALKDTNLFVVLAVGGLFTQLGLQALVHMGSSLQLLPAKGMTLPFVSYGGSSMLALGIGTGMALALTRVRYPGSDRS
jgi:cell division protein FtsW